MFFLCCLFYTQRFNVCLEDGGGMIQTQNKGWFQTDDPSETGPGTCLWIKINPCARPHTHREKCRKPWHVACHRIIQHADYWRQLSHLSVSACYWVFVRASLIHAGQVHQVTAHTRRFSWDRCWAWQSVNSTRHNYALTFRFYLKVFPGKRVAETFCDVSLARGCWEITWIKTLDGRFPLCVSGEEEITAERYHVYSSHSFVTKASHKTWIKPKMPARFYLGGYIVCESEFFLFSFLFLFIDPVWGKNSLKRILVQFIQVFRLQTPQEDVKVND